MSLPGLINRLFVIYKYMQMSNQLWQITALIPFPVELLGSNGLPIAGAPPERLSQRSRLINSTFQYEDKVLFLRLSPHPEFRTPVDISLNGQITEVAQLIGQGYAETPKQAVENMDSLLENACDVFAFRLQIPIKIYQLEVIDITPPVMIGDERDIMLFPYSKGYEHTKFRNSQYIMTALTERDIGIALLPPEPQTRTSLRGVMRWYHKALSASADLDKFLWLWIALELLYKADGIKVKEPYKTSCGHIISSCPDCGKSIEKEMMGESLKRFLTENLLVNEIAAKELWGIRQVVHGNNVFTKRQNENLPKNCMILKAAVNLGIKKGLGFSQDAPPVVYPMGLSYSQLHLMGRRRIAREDLI